MSLENVNDTYRNNFKTLILVSIKLRLFFFQVSKEIDRVDIMNIYEKINNQTEEIKLINQEIKFINQEMKDAILQMNANLYKILNFGKLYSSITYFFI